MSLAKPRARITQKRCKRYRARCSSFGVPKEALELLERAYAIRSTQFGDDHPQTLWTLGQIGRTQRDLGHTDAALKTLNAVMAARLRVLKPDHPDVGATRANLETTRYQRAPSPEGAGKSRQAWAALIDMLGDQPPMRAMVEGRLASVLLEARRLPEADAAYRTALATLSGQDSTKDRGQARSRNTLP